MLAVVGLVVSSAFAGEVLVNQETGQVRVEGTNLWRSANAFELEAFRNPGTEVPVWSSNHWEKVNFFFSRWVNTATDVVVYKDEKIQSLAKEVKDDDGVISFLWYKIFLIVGMVLAMVGVLWKDRRNSRLSLPVVTIIIAFSTVVAFATMATVATTVTNPSLVATFGAGVTASLALAIVGKDLTDTKFILFIYIILVTVAMMV